MPLLLLSLRGDEWWALRLGTQVGTQGQVMGKSSADRVNSPTKGADAKNELQKAPSKTVCHHDQDTQTWGVY